MNNIRNAHFKSAEFKGSFNRANYHSHRVGSHSHRVGSRGGAHRARSRMRHPESRPHWHRMEKHKCRCSLCQVNLQLLVSCVSENLPAVSGIARSTTRNTKSYMNLFIKHMSCIICSCRLWIAEVSGSGCEPFSGHTADEKLSCGNGRVGAWVSVSVGACLWRQPGKGGRLQIQSDS